MSNDDDLEQRKSDVWSMDEVRSGAETTESPTDDKSSEEADTTDTTTLTDTPDTSNTPNKSDASDTPDSSHTPDTDKTDSEATLEAEGETVRQMALDADAKGVVVRDLHNVNVYLYESVYREMRVKYKELDSEYFATHNEDLSKNKDFFNAVFRAGLQSPQLKEELEID